MCFPSIELDPKKILKLLSELLIELFSGFIFKDFLNLIEKNLKIEFTNKNILKKQVIQYVIFIYFQRSGNFKIISNSCIA